LDDDALLDEDNAVDEGDCGDGVSMTALMWSEFKRDREMAKREKR